MPMTNENLSENKPKPLAGLSIQIATPCGDGKYDRSYLTSFHNSACVLIELGANIDLAEMPGCADLGLARSKIFGNFLRSNHDFLMMIDSDMGWTYSDVVRLVMAKRDFVGAAGPKKRYPIEFAANNCDEEGKIMPVNYEANTGLVECTEVGMAFMLISKSCAQKIADNYQDLKFPGDNKLDEYAVFDPMFCGTGSNRRRLSEDYAFCHRWRRIGGKIFLLPDVFLTHTGTHTWSGQLIDALNGKVNNGPQET